MGIQERFVSLGPCRLRAPSRHQCLGELPVETCAQKQWQWQSTTQAFAFLTSLPAAPTCLGSGLPINWHSLCHRFLCPCLLSGGAACRIADIELEMSRTQKNKATEYHMGQLKARLAKLRTEVQEGAKKVLHFATQNCVTKITNTGGKLVQC